jgi:hypothetical protein
MRIRVLGIGLAVGALALANAASASAAELYVDDSGTDTGACTAPASPCATITFALNQAGGNTIHIGGGTYAEALVPLETETLIEDSTFIAAAAGDAIVSAPSGGIGILTTVGVPITVQDLTVRSDNTAVQLNSDSTLTGNTFDSPSVTGPTTADVVVGALSGSPSITGNTFVDPVAGTPQVGLYLNAVGSPTVTGNKFTGFNQAIFGERGPGTPLTPTISQNEITGTNSGAGIRFSSNVEPTLTANFVHSPGTGGSTAIDLQSTGAATLSRNRTIGHSVGISINGASSATLESDLMVKATGTNLTIASPTTATNITAADSSAPSEVTVNAVHLNLDSSIIGDAPLGVSALIGGTCTVTFSRGHGETGCDTGFTTTANPMFVNPAANDYHLANTSPMIDAGNTAAPAPGALDFDGDARAIDGFPDCDGPDPGRRDIGADESTFQLIPPCVPPVGQPQPAKKKCKKGRKLKKGKCVKKKRKKRK